MFSDRTGSQAAHSTLGLKIFRRMGLSETPLLLPESRLVSSCISARIWSKSENFLPATRTVVRGLPCRLSLHPDTAGFAHACAYLVHAEILPILMQGPHLLADCLQACSSPELARISEASFRARKR